MPQAGLFTRRHSSEKTIDIVVTEGIKKAFEHVVVKGAGGHQHLSRMITDQLVTGDPVLRFTPEEFRRIVRYATAYGDGTFQRRLLVIIAQWTAQNFDALVTAMNGRV